MAATTHASRAPAEPDAQADDAVRNRRLLPGDPTVWKVAALAGALVLGLLFWQVALVKREYFTGTNSTIGRSVSAIVGPGDELCVRGLQIPPGTHRVRFDAATARPGARLRVDLRAGGRRASGSGAAPNATRGFADVPVSVSGGSAPASLCVRSSGPPVTLFGVFELRSDDVSPSLNGRATGHPVALWYLPAAGETRTWLASLGDMTERAARFRPRFVGAWLYLLLVFVVLPGLAYGAVRVLARAATRDRGWLPVAAAVGLLAFANAAAWSLITPPFDAPDEMEHYAYTQYLAETGNAPCQSCDRQVRSSEEILAVDGARMLSYIEAPDGRPPWLKADEQRWKRRDRQQDPARDDGGGVTTASSHAPPYYALAAPAYWTARAAGGSVFDRLSAVRLVSAALAALTAALATLIVLELLPGRPVAAAIAGLLVAFQPMFGFIGGAVNNDSGVNAALALLVYLLVRAMRRGLTPPLAAGIGATLVLAPLLKLTGYAAFPPALLALAVILWRQHERRDLTAWATLIASFVALSVAWSLLSPAFDRSVYATADGGAPGSQPTIASARSEPRAYASYVWQVFLPRLPFMEDLHIQKWPAYDIYLERGFGAFGWYAIKFPPWVYVVILLGMGAAALLALRATWIEWAAVRRRLPELAVLGLLVATVILGVHASFFSASGDRAVVAEQGRYAFPAITAFAALAAFACFGLGRRRVGALGAVLVVAMVGLSYAAQLLALGRFFS